MARMRVLVADDHTIVRKGLVSLLAESGECEVVAEAADGLEAVEKAQATRPDVAILDLSMPRLSGNSPQHAATGLLRRPRSDCCTTSV